VGNGRGQMALLETAGWRRQAAVARLLGVDLLALRLL
jgi:hypothetical protein